LNYLVKIDERGRLRWHRNNQLVDTTAGKWKDAGNGGGIVPRSMSLDNKPSKLPSKDIPMVSESEGERINPDNHVATQISGSNSFNRFFHRHFTIRGIAKRLVRRIMRNNTWIYVSVCASSLGCGFAND
ncbi:hypothetical protein AMATHDRAFT_144143, partial [Amanita thiersii Skay4041]